MKKKECKLIRQIIPLNIIHQEFQKLGLIAPYVPVICYFFFIGFIKITLFKI